MYSGGNGVIYGSIGIVGGGSVVVFGVKSNTNRGCLLILVKGLYNGNFFVIASLNLFFNVLVCVCREYAVYYAVTTKVTYANVKIIVIIVGCNYY